MRQILRVGLLASAACLVLATSAATQQVRHATVTEVLGDVTIKLTGGDWQPATEGAVLHEKDELKTGSGAFARLLLDEEGSTAQLEVKENSHMRLNTLGLDSQTEEKVTLLDLAIGKVLVHAEKLQGNSKFEVRTPTSTTGVRGTIFEVSAQRDSAAESPTP